MKPVKIAMIGTGHDHSGDCFRSLLKNSDCFEVVGLCEPTEEYRYRVEGERAQKIFVGAKRYTLEELLSMDDLEAVAVEAGKEYGVTYAQMFAERGLPVFIDKPGCTDLPRWEKFITTMKEKQLPMQLGYMYRFNPVIAAAIERAKSGELGEIFAVEAQMSVRHETNKRKWLRRYKGGTMFFLGCHLIDLICEIQGFPTEIISHCTQTGNEDIDCDDYGFALLKYPNGVSFAKTCSSEVNGFDRRQLVISGTKGTIEIRPLEITIGPNDKRTVGKITTLDTAKCWEDGSTPLEPADFNRHDAMMRYFAMTVRGLVPRHRSYDYELELLRCVIKACGADEDVFLPGRVER